MTNGSTPDILPGNPVDLYEIFHHNPVGLVLPGEDVALAELISPGCTELPQSTDPDDAATELEFKDEMMNIATEIILGNFTQPSNP